MAAAGLAAAALWPRDGGPPPAAAPSGIGAAVSTSAAVAVNFITEPYEAQMLVDGVLLVGADGRPLTTPCTATEVTPTTRRVTFRRADHEDLDAGPIDFAATREVVARWR